ncbi:MAG: hypothetical protein V1914_03280 [archaeon]
MEEKEPLYIKTSKILAAILAIIANNIPNTKKNIGRVLDCRRYHSNNSCHQCNSNICNICISNKSH